MGDPVDADGLLAALAAWAADQRLAGEVAARSRERWLRQQALEATTWTGMLVELAEAGRGLVVVTSSQRLVGRLLAVGEDVAVLAARRATVVLALDHVCAVHLGAAGPETGERSAALGVRFAAALAALAAERLPVRLGLVGGEAVTGELSAVGVDVVSLRSPATVCPLRAVETCTPLGG